ncbi:MAG: PilZ domain-containing protein [Deltaproteobacteria bacterium]|nr:PilZ domain-containing protein [Deltaproteobacteria bacterium]
MVVTSDRDRRGLHRVEIYAQATFRGAEVQIMDVRNLSSGGVYLVGTPQEYPELVPGREFELVIFGTEDGAGDEEEFNIICRARVIRVDPGWPDKRPPGFGVTLDPADQDQRDRLANLLLRASAYRPGGRTGD